MIVFKRGNIVIAQGRVDTGNPQQKGLMAEDILAVSFTTGMMIPFEIGDYADFEGQRYYINQLPSVEKESTLKYNYKFNLEAEQYNLGKEEYFFLAADNSLRETDFDLMGDIQTFADLLILNMNRVYPGVWSLGIIANSDHKNISFSQDNCLTALGKIAQAFSTEYHIDGTVINIYIRQQNSGLSFSYGKGRGLYKITRNNKDNSNVITRLYAYGSDRNIASDYKGGAKRLMLPAGFYRENNTAKYGIIEGVQVFDDIYPHRVGTVTDVDPSDELTFTDSGINFNVNTQLIPGTSAKVVFNTGLLAGYKFDVNLFNNTTKVFRINVNKDEKSFTIPSSVLRPAVGDQYVLEDIIMPQSYIDVAEALLEQKALDYLSANSVPNLSYTIEIDPLCMRKQNIKPVLGDNIRIYDADLGVDKQIRIISIARDINIPDSYKVTIADTYTPSLLNRIITAQVQTAQILNTAKLTDPNRIRRNYKDVQELQSLIFDVDGNYYSGKIKPLSIETTMLSVGARSQQFTLSGVLFSPNLGGVASDFGFTGGQLVHFTIATLPRTWNISPGIISSLTSGVPYFIYARCSVAGSTASIFLSTAAIVFNSDPAFYHFLIGVLHTDIDTVRGISLTYGQTNINGRYITTGAIKSNDGLTYFDLDNGVIGGAINFGNNGTSTLVDGNLVTSGTIILSDGVTQKTGLTGEGALPTSVRFWAGAAFADRATAPTRITDDGHLYSVQGRIGAWDITTNGFENTDPNGAIIHQLVSYGTDDKIETFLGTNLYGIGGKGWLASFSNTHAGGSPNYGVYIDIRRGYNGPPVVGSGNIALYVANGEIWANVRDRALNEYVMGVVRYYYDSSLGKRFLTLETS